MICLINPHITSAERYGRDIGDIGGHQLSLGIYYLAGYLREKGFPVQVVDAEAQGLAHEEVVDLLDRAGVRVAGITSTTVGFRKARGLAEMIRARLPGVHLVTGGPHTTAMPLETMKTGAFDFGVVREGEQAFYALCRHLLEGRGRLEDVPNLLYRSNGEIRQSERTGVIADLDVLPLPARDLCPDLSLYKPPVGAYRRKPVANVITSRGCPYKCIFCDNNTFGRKVRYFSAEYVAREIRTLMADFGVREIAFLDDTFVLNQKRLRRIFGLLEEEGLSFPWTCMTRVNNLDYEMLAFMKKSGCWQIRIGIESGSQEVLDFIKKGITLEQVRKVTEWCHRLGIRVTGFFIIGHHVDTPETIDRTIDFALSIPLTDVVVTINTPIPGTESYDLARAYGSYDESDWMSLNYWTPVFEPHGLTRDFMLAKQAEFYRRFYTRPGILLRQLSKIRDLASVKTYIRNALLGRRFISR